MAETVITDLRTVEQGTRHGSEPDDPRVTQSRRCFKTTSRWASPLNASVIRDLYEAMSVFATPDSATVAVVTEEGRPVRLVAEWSVPI